MKRFQVLISLLLVLVILAFSGCSNNITPPQTEEVWPRETDVDWILYGTFRNATGSYSKNVVLYMEGSIVDQKEEVDSLELFITFPDDFYYQLNSSDNRFTSMNGRANDLPHLFIVPTLVYDMQADKFAMSYFALSLEEECFIMLFESMPSHYLVASTDPQADPQELLDYFSDFIEAYSFDR